MAITPPQGLLSLGAPKIQQAQQPKGLLSLGSGTFKQQAQTALQNSNQITGPDYTGAQQVNAGGYDANRAQATGTAQNYFNQQLNDRYKREDNDFRQQMANRGIDSGTDAYKRESELYNQNKNKAYQDAAFQAYQAGGLEQQQRFNQELGARQQGVNEANAAANFGLQGLNTQLGALGTFAGQQSAEGMQQAGFGFQKGENAADRSFQGGQNQLDRGLQTQLQTSQFDENKRDRTFQQGENQANRQLTAQEAANQRQFLGTESQLGRTHEAGMRQAAHQEELARMNDQQGFEAAQNQLQRDLEQILGTADKDLIGKIIAAIPSLRGGDDDGGDGGGGDDTQTPGVKVPGADQWGHPPNHPLFNLDPNVWALNPTTGAVYNKNDTSDPGHPKYVPR